MAHLLLVAAIKHTPKSSLIAAGGGQLGRGHGRPGSSHGALGVLLLTDETASSSSSSSSQPHIRRAQGLPSQGSGSKSTAGARNAAGDINVNES